MAQACYVNSEPKSEEVFTTFHSVLIKKILPLESRCYVLRIPNQIWRLHVELHLPVPFDPSLGVTATKIPYMWLKMPLASSPSFSKSWSHLSLSRQSPRYHGAKKMHLNLPYQNSDCPKSGNMIKLAFFKIFCFVFCF